MTYTLSSEGCFRHHSWTMKKLEVCSVCRWICRNQTEWEVVAPLEAVFSFPLPNTTELNLLSFSLLSLSHIHCLLPNPVDLIFLSPLHQLDLLFYLVSRRSNPDLSWQWSLQKSPRTLLMSSLFDLSNNTTTQKLSSSTRALLQNIRQASQLKWLHRVQKQMVVNRNQRLSLLIW
jgi:hypothetical protein